MATAANPKIPSVASATPAPAPTAAAAASAASAISRLKAKPARKKSAPRRAPASAAKASPELISSLVETLETVAGALPQVRGKKMFGCHALWAGDQVFGLVWKEGRLGFRLPDEAAYIELMSREGASPWKVGSMIIAHWVLVPVAMHGQTDALKEWAAQAHRLALRRSPTLG